MAVTLLWRGNRVEVDEEDLGDIILDLTAGTRVLCTNGADHAVRPHDTDHRGICDRCREQEKS